MAATVESQRIFTTVSFRVFYSDDYRQYEQSAEKGAAAYPQWYPILRKERIVYLAPVVVHIGLNRARQDFSGREQRSFQQGFVAQHIFHNAQPGIFAEWSLYDKNVRGVIYTRLHNKFGKISNYLTN
jgi:hypothetical protein